MENHGIKIVGKWIPDNSGRHFGTGIRPPLRGGSKAIKGLLIEIERSRRSISKHCLLRKIRSIPQIIPGVHGGNKLANTRQPPQQIPLPDFQRPYIRKLARHEGIGHEGDQIIS